MADDPFPMRKPRQLICSAEDFQRLNNLLQSSPVPLSEMKLRKLRVLRALCNHEEGTKIAPREGITEAAVSKILKKTDALSLAVVLDQIARSRSGAKRKHASPRSHAGRPGHESLDQWAVAISVDDDAIFELATLVLTRDVQIATIAVREGRQSDFIAAAKDKQHPERLQEAAAKALTQLNREIHAAARTPVFWTRLSMQDTMLEDIFHRLKEHFDRIMGELGSGSIISAATPLKERFGPRFRHVVLSSGRQELCDVEFEKVAVGVQAIHIRANTEIGFLRHLEAALHHRRLTKSCAGFLPTTSQLFNLARHGFPRNISEPFVWEVAETGVLDYLKIHALTQDYFAARGVLTGMNSNLWPKIPYQDEISFRTLSVSTRIKIEDVIAPGWFRVLVSPIPGIEYRIVVPWQGSEREFEKRARKLFKENLGTKRFIYDTRHSTLGGSRASIAVPEDFLVRKKPSKLRKGQGVVLLPRHFVTPEPEIGIENLPAFAAKMTQTVCVSEAQEHPALGNLIVFYAPFILLSILRDIKKGSYWERLIELEHWQTSLYEAGNHASNDWGRAFSELSLKLRAEAVLEKDAWDKFMHLGVDDFKEMSIEERVRADVEKSHGEPVSPDENRTLLKEKDIPELVQQGLRNPEVMAEALKAASSVNFYKELAAQMAAWESILGVGEHSKRSRLAPEQLRQFNRALLKELEKRRGTKSPFTWEDFEKLKSIFRVKGAKEKTSREQPPGDGDDAERNPSVAEALDQLNPLLLDELMRRRATKSPDPQQDFENIVKEVDADYLIRNLDAATRKQFEAGAKSWAKECERVIAAEYWPNHCLNLARVRSMVNATSAASSDQHEDEIRSLCDDLLGNFRRNNTRFAMRRLVENMQRCVLRGIPAAPIVVESEASVLRRWRSLLRTVLKHRLKATGEQSMDSQFLGAVLLKDIHPDAESPGELSPDETVAFDEEVDEICDLIRSLGNEVSEDGLRRFFAFAHAIDLPPWQAAMAELEELRPGAGWTGRITEALRLCRQEPPAGASLALLKKLRRIF